MTALHMTAKTRKFLKALQNTEDASTQIARHNAKIADALVRLGLAVIIPISTGGGWVALTEKGINLK